MSSAQQVTQGIVLTRTNYGEADRIVTFLTPDNGKISLMAKGVRRPKSKLAGGIELFSVSDVTFLAGRGSVGRLISSRLRQHYAGIAADIDRTMLAYELIKLLNKVTEDEVDEGYFLLLQQTLLALNNPDISAELTEAWFLAQLLRISGHTPNWSTDTNGDKLVQGIAYVFSFDDACCAPNPQGQLTADAIKFARLLFTGSTPGVLARVTHAAALVGVLLPLIQQMRRSYLLQ